LESRRREALVWNLAAADWNPASVMFCGPSVACNSGTWPCPLRATSLYAAFGFSTVPDLRAVAGTQGQPASIQATARSRSASDGFGFVPAGLLMGNCSAGGKPTQPHPGSCITQTPQRIVSLFAVTMECWVKSSPLVSLAEWHSTQYVAKNPCPQLAHVSELDPESDRDPELDPDPEVELEEHAAAASNPTASKA
jgi:hypothetical protein